MIATPERKFCSTKKEIAHVFESARADCNLYLVRERPWRRRRGSLLRSRCLGCGRGPDDDRPQGHRSVAPRDRKKIPAHRRAAVHVRARRQDHRRLQTLGKLPRQPDQYKFRFRASGRKNNVPEDRIINERKKNPAPFFPCLLLTAHDSLLTRLSRGEA